MLLWNDPKTFRELRRSGQLAAHLKQKTTEAYEPMPSATNSWFGERYTNNPSPTGLVCRIPYDERR